MKALITGVSGQDGHYLSELLFMNDYEIVGLDPHRATPGPVPNGVRMVQGDVTDAGSLTRVIKEEQPDEVYNLAAMAYVGASWNQPAATMNINAVGVLNLLEAVRHGKPDAKVYQASTSEMFGSSPAPQNEDTPFHPRSPYGVAKLAAHWSMINYRESHGLQTYCGILFNHESPLRGVHYVTRKIARAAARISLGLDDRLMLGNMDARRDWGYAGDYVKAMWSMVQGDPDEYVIATGETHSVREFVDVAFQEVGLDYREYVHVDPELYRPAEVDVLCGDASKARSKLKWKPRVTFEGLVSSMVRTEVNAHQS